MENPRPEKVAVVDEVKERLSAADATVLADYRGIDVPGMADLRSSLRAAGGDVKIYKNTLVRFAANDLGLEIDEMLVGPTAIAFVGKGEDGNGDPVLVAKALRDFAKGNENLVIKGGLLGDRLLTADEIDRLAQVAPRDELLARFAGGLAAPLQKMAGLLQALPRNFAYGLAALIEQNGGVEAADAAPADAAPDEVAPDEVAPDEVASDEDSSSDKIEADAPEAPAETETEAVADEAAADEPAADAGEANAEDAAPADSSDETTEDSASEDSASDSDSEDN